MKQAGRAQSIGVIGNGHGQTLLEKARLIGRKVTRLPDDQRDELVDLAIAYFNGDVSGTQVAQALGLSPNGQGHAQGRLATVLRSAIRTGLVTPPLRASK